MIMNLPLFDCEMFRINSSSLWSSRSSKVMRSNSVDGTPICNFIDNPDSYQKKLLLLGGLHLIFDQATNIFNH